MQALFNIQYKSTAPALGLDIYLPDAVDKPTAAIVYYHGGGWIEGDKDGIDNGFKLPIKNALLERGIAIISVNYSLLTHALNFPNNIEDCLDATRFIRKHAATYNINPHNIGVLGTSAGAHLAILQAYCAHNDFRCAPELEGVSARVNYLVNIYGPTDLVSLFQLEDFNENNFAPDMYQYMCHLVKVMTSFDPISERERAIKVLNNYCPLQLIEAEKAQLVPTLTLHGEADEVVPFSQAISLQNALKKRGVEHELYSYPNVLHAFEQMTTPQEIEMRKQCLDFIYRHASPSSQQAL